MIDAKTLLRIWRVLEDGHTFLQSEFDDPVCISRAAEGFCPYSKHTDEEYEGQVYPLTRNEDGTVTCPFRITIFPGDGIKMRFEFCQELVTPDGTLTGCP